MNDKKLPPVRSCGETQKQLREGIDRLVQINRLSMISVEQAVEELRKLRELLNKKEPEE